VWRETARDLRVLHGCMLELMNGSNAMTSEDERSTTKRWSQGEPFSCKASNQLTAVGLFHVIAMMYTRLVDSLLSKPYAVG